MPCTMMRRLGTFGHRADERVDVVRLPYGAKRSAPAAFLTLVVPKAIDGLAAIEADLDAGRLAAWTGELAGKRVDLSLPRFTSRTPARLDGALRSLGMQLAFTDRADFSKMSSEPLKIDAVIHEAWVRTHEAGSEAAAATAVLVAPTGMPPRPDVAVTADRPFLWLITDAASGALLFIGRVVEPQDPGAGEGGMNPQGFVPAKRHRVPFGMA